MYHHDILQDCTQCFMVRAACAVCEEGATRHQMVEGLCVKIRNIMLKACQAKCCGEISAKGLEIKSHRSC